jgi:predicted lipoprotein with Yx(FWY)xxD motif
VRALLAMLSVICLVAAGCGGDDDDGGGGGEREPASMAPASTTDTTQASDRAATGARKGRKIRVVDDSQFGRILANGRGQAVYYFDRESTERSECYGACARAWPPVLTKGKPRAGDGARSGLLGRTERRNGKSQVTYDGHPLYYYVDDSPGRVLCHDVEEFGGLWLVVRPDGTPVD